MTLKQRISAFTQVGGFIDRHLQGNFQVQEEHLHQGLDKVIEVAHQYNNWFTQQFTLDAIRNIGSYLTKTVLEKFTGQFSDITKEKKTVAIICAGNVPMVGFHDIMCVLFTNNTALIKLSSDDNVLLPFFLKLLTHYEPDFVERILFADGKLGKFDAIIATGSDNTASHLHYYFGRYPNIIRKSRTSIAILEGDETADELTNLGKDIFQYFGLGCRNVGKLLVPENYSFNLFFESIVDFGFVINNKKYGNNYDYHRAIYLLEQIPFLDNNFLMVAENPALHSPVGVLYYQRYAGKDEVSAYVRANEGHLQCVVGRHGIPFGYSQRPVITDFADNVNTMAFLVNL